MLRLLSLTAVAALVIAACGGSSDRRTPGTPETDLHLVARGVKFNHKVLTVPANTEVSLTFANEDAGTLHNVGVYKNKGGRDKIFVSELITGRKTEAYTFRTPGPGEYYFRCDAHTDMSGTFFVQ